VTLNAPTLTAFQQCPRKYLLNQSGEIARWRPKSLFLRQLRAAIHSLSTDCGKPEDVTAEAVAGFMEAAANPGLDTQSDPFTVARSLCSILKTSIARIHACGVPRSKPHPHVFLSDTVTWSLSALYDGNQLHSWTAVDSLSDAVLARELHRWSVVGDCAASGLPMTLHVIEIGRQAASGRFNSAWCRTFAHPAIASRWAFQQKDGSPLQGKWKPIYFENGRNDPQTWIELMERDGVRLLKDIPIKQLSVDQANEVKREILIEAGRMQEINGKDWRSEPMRRTACDVPLCGWQAVCYSTARRTDHTQA